MRCMCHVGIVITHIYYYYHQQQQQPDTDEITECLLSFNAESFVFQFAIQKYTEQETQNYNFACCFV